MTEWMSHDGYGVEGQDVCSPASHQARCGVAFDMGHLWPAGHKWVQIGFTQRQVGVDRMLCGSSAGWLRRTLSVLFPENCLFSGSPGVWRGWLAYTVPASGAPRGYKTSSASIGIGYPECIFHTRPSAFT